MAEYFNSKKLLEQILSDGTVLSITSFDMPFDQSKYLLGIRNQNTLREVSFHHGRFNGYLEVRSGSSFYQPSPSKKDSILSDFAKVFKDVLKNKTELIRNCKELVNYMHK